jgi:hypothetical protein
MARLDSRTFAVAAIAIVLGSASAASCAGKEAPSANGDGGVDSGAGTFTVGCPSTPPWTRTTANGPKNPCPKDGQLCEYGTDYDFRCNTIVFCSGGEWAVPITPGGGSPPKCGSPAPTVGPNPSDCPASRTDITPGASCSTKSACAYDGSTCMCGVFCPSFPVGQRDCDPDAGVTTNCCDRNKPPTWHCFNGPAYCPSPRPHLGDPCAKKGDTCALTPPAECGQTILQCNGATWELPNTQCPISTAKAKRDIAYVSPSEAARLRDELLSTKLATYRYKLGDSSTHLGFVIEDMPEGSPAVLASREQVDLYGYVSMAVAAIQEQQKQINRLEAELKRTQRNCASTR